MKRVVICPGREGELPLEALFRLRGHEPVPYLDEPVCASFLQTLGLKGSPCADPREQALLVTEAWAETEWTPVPGIREEWLYRPSWGLPRAMYATMDRYGMEDLCGIIALLRAPGGCPWDREQTHASLRQSLIEEAYEVIDAIDRESMEDLCEELGDLLLQVVFHAELAREDGRFDFRDVAHAVAQKMVFRHRHVFGSLTADTPEEVLDQWDEIKQEEHPRETLGEILEAVPHSFPALMRAAKVWKKAAKAHGAPLLGQSVWEELREAVNALEALQTADLSQNRDEVREKCGEMLLLGAKAAQNLAIEPEMALTGAIKAFIMRLMFIERNSLIPLQDFTTDTWKHWWDLAEMS